MKNTYGACSMFNVGFSKFRQYILLHSIIYRLYILKQNHKNENEKMLPKYKYKYSDQNITPLYSLLSAISPFSSHSNACLNTAYRIECTWQINSQSRINIWQMSKFRFKMYLFTQTQMYLAYPKSKSEDEDESKCTFKSQSFSSMFQNGPFRNFIYCSTF